MDPNAIPPSDNQVVLVDHSGRRITVPAAEAQDALADPISRFHVQTSAEAQAQADEAKFGDRPIAAGLAGLGRGLSLGLSDVALTKTGLVAPETLHGLKEHNPGASAAGDVAGTAAGLLLPGVGELNAAKGVATAGEIAGRGVAAGLGRGLAATAASAAARGAVEGSLYGLGNTLSENALGETQLTAEKLASSVGMGALLGIGGSELGELLGAAARPVARASAKAISGLQEKFGELASERYLKAGGAIQSDIQKLTQGERADLVRALRGRGHVGSFTSAADSLGSINEDIAGRAVELGKELDLAPLAEGSLNPATENEDAKKVIADSLRQHGELIGQTLRDADRAGARFDASDLADRVQSFIKDLNPAERRIIKPKIENVLGDLNEALGRNFGFSKLNDLKGTLQADAEKTASDASRGLYRQLVGIFTSEIDNQLRDQIAPEAFENFLSYKRSFGMLKDAEALAEKGKGGKDIISGLLDETGHDSGEARLYRTLDNAQRIAQKGADRISGNRVISLSDYGVGGAAGLLAGGPLGVAASVGGALGNKVLRERGSSLAATALDALAKSPTFGTLADSFEQFAQGLLKTNPQALGAYGGVLANAAARSSSELLLTHAALSESDPRYRQTMEAAGLDYTEDPRQVGARAQALASIGYHLNGYDEERQKALAAFLAGRSSPAEGVAQAYRLGRDTLDRFQGLSETLSTLASNPDALTKKLAPALGPLQEHAPGVATAYAATVSNGLTFLAGKMPKSQNPLNDVPALQRPYQPGDADLARFGRYVRAVSDPSTVFEDLRHGQVTKEAVEALQAVYPRFYDDLKAQALEQLSGSKKPLDYRSRIALGNLLGTPLDGSAQPGRVIALQKAFGAAAGPAQPPPAGGRPVKPPQSMTASQALEAGLGKG